MLDPDTFLTHLYVMADECCTSRLPPGRRPGPAHALDRGGVVALALFGQWARFAGERDSCHYAARHPRPAFPALPDRSQFVIHRRAATGDD